MKISCCSSRTTTLAFAAAALAFFALSLFAPTTLQAQNIANNPGFERDETDGADGGPDGYPDEWWTREYAFRETDPQHVRTGVASFRLEGPVNSAEGVPGYGHIFNADWNVGFPELQENTTYIMEGWLKSSGIGDGFVWFFHNTTPPPPSGYPVVGYNGEDETGDWVRIRDSFTTGENGGEPFEGALHFHSNIPEGGVVWVDDVAFIQVQPHRIELTSSASTLMADGSSACNITARILDQDGNFLDAPSVDNTVTFALSGPGSLSGSNPRDCVNGITAIGYVAGETTGTVTITASSPGLEGGSVQLELIDYGNPGVPELTPAYGEDVELDWWAYHPFNEASPTYNPAILAQFEDGTAYATYDVDADYGGDLAAAVIASDAAAQAGALFLLQAGNTYTVPDTGIKIEDRDHMHFVAEGGMATIAAPPTFSGIPRPGEDPGSTVFQVQSTPGNWHDDNYAHNPALADRSKDYYFRNIEFDTGGHANTTLSFWTTRDIVFDNCHFHGAAGSQEVHTGAWCDNVWARGCSFTGSSAFALLWDGTHGSGLLDCQFDFDYYPGAVQFFSNDDCSRDVNGNGYWDNEEIRLGNYIVVSGCLFGASGGNNVGAIGASASNILITGNEMVGNGPYFFQQNSRCSQMVHLPLMPSYTYQFFGARIVGNLLTGNVNEFVSINSFNDQNTQDNPRARCSGYERPWETADGLACDSEIGFYEVRGNRVAGMSQQEELVVEHPIENNPIVGWEENLICGNVDANDPDAVPNTNPGCGTLPPTHEHLGRFTNSGALRYYLDPVNGNDAADGTSLASAWRTLAHAVENMAPASTLILRGGVYPVPNGEGEERVIIGRSDRSGQGIDEDNATILRAYGGERPIVTGNDGQAPRITIAGDFIRVEGITFGGTGWETTGAGFNFSGGGVTHGVDDGREIIGCTFYGYRTLWTGYLANTLFQGNRVINCGRGLDPPGLFFAGDHENGGVGGYGHSAVVDSNLFVHTRGQATVGWHSYHGFVVTRNVYGNCHGGFSADGRGSEHQGSSVGSDHLVANNLFWNSGQIVDDPDYGTLYYNGITLIAPQTHVINNVLVAGSRIGLSGSETYGWPTLENSVLRHNAFLGTAFPSAGAGVEGEDNIDLADGSELIHFGRSAAEIEDAFSELETLFTQGADELQDDLTDAEALIWQLMTLETGSSPVLNGAGEDWSGEGENVNIGPDAPAPGLGIAPFYYAATARGLHRWNANGDRVITTPAGSFSDNSGTTDYRGSEAGTCDPLAFATIIAPEEAGEISLDFSEFSLGAGDRIDLYDAYPIEEGALLATYEGLLNPPPSYTHDGGVLVVDFVTDGDGSTGAGYRASFSSDGTGTSRSTTALPRHFRLAPIHPNPFNATARISYELPQMAVVRLAIYNIRGQQVALLADGSQPAGRHERVFRAEQMASGLYFCVLQARQEGREAFVQTRKMMLLK